MINYHNYHGINMYIVNISKNIYLHDYLHFASYHIFEMSHGYLFFVLLSIVICHFGSLLNTNSAEI